MEDFNVAVDWLNPISEAEPSGKNTEYETKFAELETAAIATAEQQYGSTVIAGKEPDWSLILRLASELSLQTKDLRVQLLMTRALTRLHGLRGTLYGLHSVNTVSHQFWDSLHPQLVIDGENDPQIRFSALSNFADIDGLTADVRQAVVLATQLGVLTVKDLERLLEHGSIDVNGVIITETQLAQMVEDVRKSADPTSLDVPALIIEELTAIQKQFQEQMGSEFQPDLSVLQRPLQKITRLLRNDEQAQKTADEAAAQSSEASGQPHTGSAAVARNMGDIQSRRDAVRQLELVCRYLEVNEPTNPAPFLIRRAIKVMEMNFMDILKNMAPEGLTQASFITGVDIHPDE